MSKSILGLSRSLNEKKHGKISTVKGLRSYLTSNNYYEKIPFVESLDIDNNNIKPKDVAQIIKKNYNLYKILNPYNQLVSELKCLKIIKKIKK